MEVRRYHKGEEGELWRIFYNTVHQINARHYSEAQINAWAPAGLDQQLWSGKIQDIDPYVVVLEGKIVGYADLQKSGYIDHFFCHHEHQRKGVGNCLISFIMAEASRLRGFEA
ncbi:GNAT family N-acetyltransferase [Motiliproteus sp. MSK22-1]|uniref:GNAT family N-acetyltransferase n=1 Tax=Motiliproteus sp. MSK22-1 TaxID=1897630 RepID=UPI0018E93505|nr:GNAT family N-acetyltransferase [Motiliproteus sp. MSK22-1]